MDRLSSQSSEESKLKTSVVKRTVGGLMNGNGQLGPLLVVRLNGEEMASVAAEHIPCELTFSRKVASNASVQFEVASGDRHVHSLGELFGGAHFSVRVHANFGCQADCVVTSSESFDAEDLMNGKGSGVRFQPFFLPGSTGNAEELRGRGLFWRGLHFGGIVTPSSVRLSCECDE